MAYNEWFPKTRNYELEKQQKIFHPQPAISHPLKLTTVIDCKDSRSTSEFVSEKKSDASQRFFHPLCIENPLCNDIGLAFEGVDPLSKFATESALSIANKPKKLTIANHENTFESWTVKKAGILSRYTTSEKLSITTSFLSTSGKDKVDAKSQPHAYTMADKMKDRLEQLDDFDEGSVKEMLNLSQMEYVKQIEELNQELITAWGQDQRVKSLKIAIQCSKLLADVSVIPFYPSKFVLITDILDNFGNLVYDRLLEKLQCHSPSATKPVCLSGNSTSDNVPETVKETCGNWFFKIASIRELIPRLYMECALLKSYRFLDTGDIAVVLKRIAHMARGIGDPLVVAYARCYLARVGISVAPELKEHVIVCFNDCLANFDQMKLLSKSVNSILDTQKIEMSQYMNLFYPATDWMLQILAYRTPDSILVDFLEKCKNCKNSHLLQSVLSLFPHQFIADRGLIFIQMIEDCDDRSFAKHLLYQSLGSRLVLAETPDGEKHSILKDVWKFIVKLKNPSNHELNKTFGNIIRHMTPNHAFEDHYPLLLSVVRKVTIHTDQLSNLLSLSNFLLFLDMLQNESVKVDVCMIILEFFSRNQPQVITDPIVINAMMFLCKIIHNSVNALSLDDMKRASGRLVSVFISNVSFGRDFEQQLAFYVDARGSFSKLDSVLITLIQFVNRLAIDTRRIVKGNHSKKTAAFVRACAAYSFITIPSLESVYTQLLLYLASGQVALLNQCCSQADAFFKAAISAMPNFPSCLYFDGKEQQSEPFLVEYISSFVSTLLMVPDNPDTGVLYLLRGLLTVLHQYTWSPHTDTKVVVYLRVLACLSAFSQSDYLYHADRVDSNDSMYASDVKFLSEIKGIADTLLQQIYSYLKSLSDQQTASRSTYLALELFSTVHAHGDLTNDAIGKMASKLSSYLQRVPHTDPKTAKRISHYFFTEPTSGVNAPKVLSPQTTFPV